MVLATARPQICFPVFGFSAVTNFTDRRSRSVIAFICDSLQMTRLNELRWIHHSPKDRLMRVPSLPAMRGGATRPVATSIPQQMSRALFSVHDFSWNLSRISFIVRSLAQES